MRRQPTLRETSHVSRATGPTRYTLTKYLRRMAFLRFARVVVERFGPSRNVGASSRIYYFAESLSQSKLPFGASRPTILTDNGARFAECFSSIACYRYETRVSNSFFFFFFYRKQQHRSVQALLNRRSIDQSHSQFPSHPSFFSF